MSAPGFALGLEERHEDDVAEEKPAIEAIGLIKGAAAVGALSFAFFGRACSTRFRQIRTRACSSD